MVSKNKSINEQLEELTTVFERGAGMAPEAERELERRIDFLKHQQIQAVSKRNSRVAVFNAFLTALNIGILIYQVFFK